MSVILPRKQINIDFDEIDDTYLPLNEIIDLSILKNNVLYKFTLNFSENDKRVLTFDSSFSSFYGTNFFKSFEDAGFFSFIIYTIPQFSDEKFDGYVGTQDIWYLEDISLIIKKILNNIFIYSNDEYDNIFFLGLYQSGFTSLVLSVLIKNSICVCDSPLTNIFEGCNILYDPKFNVSKKELLKILLTDNASDYFNNYTLRTNILELIKKENYAPNAFLNFNFNDLNYSTQYNLFFKQYNQISFENEFLNNIKINIGKRNNDYILSLKNFINNLKKICIIISDDYISSISFRKSLKFHIVNNCVKEKDIIRLYNIEEDLDDLKLCFDENSIFLKNLKNGYNRTLGKYYDFPANFLSVGVHKIFLKNAQKKSKCFKVFIKRDNNILDHNVSSSTEFNCNTLGFLSGKGQLIESTDEWSFFGKRSLKITKIGEEFTWTDIPTTKIFKGDNLEAMATLKCNSEVSIFFVFEDVNGIQSFSKSVIINKSDFAQTIKLSSIVGDNIKQVSLRFWIKGDMGSVVYVDDINILNKKYNIAIYGSCGTKDPFTTLFNKDYKKKYFSLIDDQRHSLISTMQEKEFVNSSLLEIPDYDGSKFITKCLIEDFNKNFIEELLKNQIDFLVLDVYFDIDQGIICYDDNKIVTNAKGFDDTKYFDLMKNKKIITLFNNYDLYLKLWTKYCDEFFEFLESSCPNTKVVLSEIRSLDKVMRKDNSIYTDENFSKKVSEYNPLIIILENYIKENYDIDVIPFKKDTLINEDHVWGKHHVHYCDDYYPNFLNEFNKIVDKYD